MAKGKKKKQKQEQQDEIVDHKTIMKHIAALGLSNEYRYWDWCRTNNFPVRLEKRPSELAIELETEQKKEAKHQAALKAMRNPRKLIHLACTDTIDTERVQRPAIEHFCQAIEKSSEKPEDRASLEAMLLVIEKKSDLLFEYDTSQFGQHYFIDAFIRMHQRKAQWVREIDSWSPKSKNAFRRFASLVEHLFAKYPLPRFLSNVWLRNDQGTYRYRDWYVHLGLGQNIRTAKLPVKMTKKVAHHFMTAPDDYSVEQAIRWGQIHAMQGDKRLCEAVVPTRMFKDYKNDEFWQTVLAFFVDNPLLNRRHIGPIIDYIFFQKFDTQEFVVGPGETETRQPPQPNMRMKGRNPETLLKQVDEWHLQLGRSAPSKTLFFKRSGVMPFEHVSGNKEYKTKWTIRELLSGVELRDEGRAMHHCVASYAYDCAKGRCSIWSMEAETKDGKKKHLTIEVERKRIVEARGLQNRVPTESELNIIYQWAGAAGLQVSPYLTWGS